MGNAERPSQVLGKLSYQDQDTDTTEKTCKKEQSAWELEK